MSWLRPLSFLALAACPPPVPELPTGEEPYTLDAYSRTIEGRFLGEPWMLVQGFATPIGDEGWEVVLSPEPITVCDGFRNPGPGVLVATLDRLGEFPWGEGGSVIMYTAEGNISTKGGGVELDISGPGDKIVGGLIFDFDDNTVLNGQISVPICN